MIATSDDLASVIAAGGFSRHYVADVVVDGQRVLADVPLASCELRSTARSKIRTQGSAVFQYSDALGTSIIPEEITSWMTPYSTYLNVYMHVSVGDFSEKVRRGSFKVVGVSDSDDQSVTIANRRLTLNSRVRLRLADQFVVTERERFVAPGGPASLDSVWNELSRVSGLPVLRNVADQNIDRTIVYKESRLDALFDLAAVLDGTPYVSPDGYLTLQSNTWPAESAPLTIGLDGTVTKVTPDDLSDDGIYNQVVVRSYDESQGRILATAELTTGPLRYGGPFGRIPFFLSSEFITTTVDAQAYADAQLPKVSTVPASPYLIQCVPDPRREVGDVVPFTRNGEELVGRIDELTLSDTGPMTLKVLVDRE